MRSPRAVAASVALAIGATAPVAAVTAPPFPTLLAEARERAPRLAEANAGIARAAGLAQQAGARPNPELGVELENFGGSGPYENFGASETTVSVGVPFELGGKRPARIAAGRAELDAARARVLVAGAEYDFALAASYADAEADGVRLDLAKDALRLAEDDLRVAKALVDAGKEAALRQVQARSAVESARAGVDMARAAQAASLAELTALAGAPQPFTSVPPSLLPHAERDETLPAPDPLASPAYRAAQAAREAAARRVAVERTRQSPDLTASVGVRRFGGDDEARSATAAVAGLALPLPLFDRNRGNIAAASAELVGAEAAVSAARFEAESGVRAGRARAVAALSRIAAARDAESTAAEAYRLSRLGYEGGKLPLIEVLNARRALTEARVATVDARLERLGAEAELARLAGAPPFGDLP